MNRDQMKGDWNQVKGKIKQKWGELTDDDIAQAQGRRDELIGKIQSKYGGTKESIKRELDNMYS